MKILILLAYYNRPNLVKNALNSILKANEYYQNWILAFIDDGSPIPGKPIVEEMLKEHLDQVYFYNSNMTAEDKKQEGCKQGFYLNKASLELESDIIITLCDDDELYPTYLQNLNKFFIENPNEFSCYSKIHLYNPIVEKSEDVDCLIGHYNQSYGPISPGGRVEVSQVAWRTSAVKDKEARWPDTCIGNHDVYFLRDLSKKTKLTVESGFISQYKGIHSGQLGLRAFDKSANERLNKEKAWYDKTEKTTTEEIEVMIKSAIDKAQIWAEKGEIDASIHILLQAIAIDKDLVDKYPEVYFMLGILTKNIELLKKAAALSPKNKDHVLKIIQSFSIV